ncbi:hypothetical protein [Arthrobacter sp. CP30]
MTGPRRGFLRSFLQVVAAASWIPLLYLAVLFVGYRPPSGSTSAVLGDVVIFTMPWLTVFAALSFLFDRRSTRAWVPLSNVAFLTLSIAPAVVLACLQFIALLGFIGVPPAPR